MAGKKYNGAPFGTQTARFDVTGVHPKNKIPGTFTQIPYDKNSMLEQGSLNLKQCSKHLRKSDEMTIIKLDSHIKNIRDALRFTAENLRAIKSNKKNGSAKTIKKNQMGSDERRDSKTILKNVIKDDRVYPYRYKIPGHQEEDDNLPKKTGSKDETFADESQCKGLEDRYTIIVENLKESIRKTLQGDVQRFPMTDGNAADSITTSDSEKVNGNFGGETSDDRQSTGRRNTGQEVGSDQVDNKLNLKTSINQISAKDVTPEKQSKEDEVKEAVLTGIISFRNTTDDDVHNTNVVSSQDISEVEENKSKKKKKISRDTSLVKTTKRKLGPGVYNTVVGGFSPSRVEQRASGPGWARQLEVERLAALPHLLYKEQWEENKMLKRKLGPGSYEIKDFIQAADLKPRSHKGVCENLATRFDKGVTSFTPGPGTYGMGGVPQRSQEEKGQMSTSTKGMLDSGYRKRNLPSVGSHLGPGTYRHNTCTEELLNKVTSLKGPYDLYSGDRNKPITEGYQAAPRLADLGPGQYEIGSFVDELHSVHKKSHGGFGKMTQYPEIPTERIFLFSKAHYPKTKEFPGPGAYSAQDISKPQSVNSPGFLSSAKRDDKLSQKFFTRNFNPVGPGRYDIQKFNEAQDSNGHISVFRSKTGKPNLQMSKFLQERIRSKDVPVEDRTFINDSAKPTLSRAVTVV